MSSRLSRLDEAETLRGLVRDLREGIYVADRSGNVLDANPAFLEMFGVASLKELRMHWASGLAVDAARRKTALETLHREGAIRDFEMEIRRVGGEPRTVIDSATRARDPRTGETFTHGILVDITDRKRLEQRLLDQSLRDPLTGCFNRRFLHEFERRHEGSAQPSLLETWGCIMVDLDYFKQYNDEFGHEAGDAVLNRIARFLMRETRAEESVVRMGGDEFLLLLDGADATATDFAARRLQVTADRELIVPFSTGWAAREEGETLEKTIARADQRLLKSRGQSRSGQRPRLVMPA
ncbi:MAG: sensor domain-containing diguanylate cyclase [Thermoanaerobaculia bacterium]